MNKGRLLRISLLLCIGLYGSGIAGSVKDKNWLKSKAGGDGALAFQYNGIHLVELSDGNNNKVGNGKFPEFSHDASILAWQDGSEIKGRLRKGDTNVRTLISGVHGKSGVHWISDKEFVCYKGDYLIVNAYTGQTREDEKLKSLPGPPHDCRGEEGDVKLCDDGVWVVLKGEDIKMSDGGSSSRPGHCSGSLSPCGRSVTGLHSNHDRCELKSFRSGGPSGTLSRTVGDCGSKGFDNQRWSSNNKNFVVAQWECQDKVGVWEVGSSDVCLLADCGGETYGDFTAGSPRVTSWGSGPEPEPEPDPTDDTKPSAPSNLSGSAAGRTQVDLSWGAAEDGESGIDKYLIYRDGQKIGESSSTSYSDKNCSAGTTYRYAVSAVNGEGMEGDKSNEVSVKTEDSGTGDPDPEPDPQPNPSGTVVSYDFTSMNSAPSNVEQNGGSWTSKGWRVDNNNEQLRIDLGQDLTKGTAEIVVTLNSNPTAPGGKINYFCVSELAQNSHGSDGSKAYLRTGQAKYNFSKFKAYWKGFDHGEWERTVGSSGDWVTDGTTEHKISISWDENAKVTARTPPGEIGETLQKFGPIRYVFLGSYNYGGVIPTMTFKSLTVVSDGAQPAPAPEDPAADETAPEIVSATGNGTSVTVVFSEAVEKSSAEQTGNYSIDNNITVSNASLGSDNKTVILTTSSLAEGTTYTVTVSNVKDRASTPNTIASGAQATFEVAAPGAGEIAYQYFEGSFSTLPDCNALTPKAEGTCTGFDIGKATRSENYCIRFIGKLRIDQEGEYTFATSSDDGSALYIGGTQVVDNDGVHAMEQKSGTINLTAGEHPIVVVYFQGGGGQNLEVSWKAPGAGSMEAIPAARLSVADANDLTISRQFRLGTAENARALSIGWAANRLTVSNLDPSHRYTLRLVDPSGRVLGTTVTKGSVNVSATVPAAARGVLLLQVHDGTKEMSRKILRR